LHYLLKIILSADLLPFLELGSIPNSHTNNPIFKKGKAAPKPMEKQKTRWAREPKSKTAHSTPFFENVVVWAAVLWKKSM